MSKPTPTRNWTGHAASAYAETAAAFAPGTPARRVALRKLAIAAGFAPLSWDDARLERLLAEGPAAEGATAAPTTTAPAVFDEDRVRSIAREEAEAAAKASTAPRTLTVVTPRGTNTVAGTVHPVFDDLLMAMAVGHTYLYGPAGTGKSTLVKQAAEALGFGDRVFVTGSVFRESQLLGYTTDHDAAGNVRYVETEFYRWWTRGGVFLFDEVDSSNPAALLAFNQALANGICAFPTGTLKKHPEGVCVATANTNGKGNGGRQYQRARLDGAFMDRFVAAIHVGYDTNMERAIAPDVAWAEVVQAVRGAVERLSVDMLVTPRATLGGGALLAQYEANGFTREQAIAKVAEFCLWRGAPADTVAAVKREAGLAA
jgi:hypothetical protein